MREVQSVHSCYEGINTCSISLGKALRGNPTYGRSYSQIIITNINQFFYGVVILKFFLGDLKGWPILGHFPFIDMNTTNRIRLIALHLKSVLPNQNVSLSGIMFKFCFFPGSTKQPQSKMKL